MGRRSLQEHLQRGREKGRRLFVLSRRERSRLQGTSLGGEKDGSPGLRAPLYALASTLGKKGVLNFLVSKRPTLRRSPAEEGREEFLWSFAQKEGGESDARGRLRQKFNA